jgi:competence protein ComEA
VNSAERRALLTLIFWLSVSSVLDLILTHRPAWVGGVLGSDRIEDLLAAGRETPPVRVEPPKRDLHPLPESPGEGERPAAGRHVRGARRQIPYDRSGKLDLNAADSTALVLLDGVGPVLARRILQHRERMGGIRGQADLLEVRGIGPKTMAKLLPQITLGAAKDSLGNGPVRE